MSPLIRNEVSDSAEEISTSNLVGEEDLVGAAVTMTHSMCSMVHTLQETCYPLMGMPGIHPEAPVRASLNKIAAELVRLADAAEQLVVYVFDLYRASLEPPVPISLGTEALALMDSCLAIIQNSARVVHSACRGNALPGALYSACNPFPILLQYYDPVPPTVALWKELARFQDVCAALDRLLPAILAVRTVVQQAVDERDARFDENRALTKTFFKEARGTVDSACIHLSVDARRLWCFSKISGVQRESLHEDKHPRRLCIPQKHP
ncbi:hypothetical protein FB45DRAFT_953450 [Roridomyces roridus]|uniref:Uncharacterized protein n=1 Tax=Roridomyces roridus TaxID=1738132 RepID=A0AAD7AZG0_9AGAR|nr:hypothetical protein FB45DRAFT_953450 [Roridomyces roridus]